MQLSEILKATTGEKLQNEIETVNEWTCKSSKVLNDSESFFQEL